MANAFEETIRLIIEAKGTGDLARMGEAVDALEKEFAKASPEVRALVDEIARLADAKKGIDSLKALDDQLQRNAAQLKEAKAGLNALNAEFSKSDRSSADVKVAFQQAERAVRDLANEQLRLQRSSADVRANLRASGVDANNLTDAERKLATATADVAIKINEASSAIKTNRFESDKAAGAIDNNNKRISSSYKDTIKSVGFLRNALGALGVAFSLTTIKDSIVSILGVGDAAERTKIQLAQLYGSQAEGNKAYEELRTLAKETGQSFQGVLEAATRLKATGLDPLDGTLKSLINQTAALGGSQETLTGIGLALGQMYAKQKIQTEEILQLVERGVPAFDLLAKVTGKQGAELQKLIQSGSLGRDTIKALINEIGRASDGAAAKSLGTLSGLVTQLKDQFTAFLERIANSGAADFFKEKLKGIRNEIELMVSDGRLQKFAEDTSKSITEIGGAVSAVAEKFRLFKGVKDALVGSTQAAVAQVSSAGISIVAGLTEAFTRVTGAGENVSQTFKEMAERASGVLKDGLEQAKSGANALGASFDLASDKGDKVAATFENVKAGADSTASAFRNVQSGVDSTAAKVIDMGKAADFAARRTEALADAYKTLGVKSQAALQDEAKAAGDALNAIVESYKAGGSATAATTTDVANAFKKYAEAQRATVADAKDLEKAGVEGALNIKAALLGLSNAPPPTLKPPDLKPYVDAVSSVKQGNDEATGSLQQLGDQAGETSGDVSNAAQAIQNIYAGFANELGKTSQAAIEQFTKLTRQIFELGSGIADFSGLARFGKAAEDAYNIINERIARQKQGVSDLADQYANLSDSAIQNLIKTRGGLDDVAAGFDQIAQSAKDGKSEFDLLGAQDLSALVSAAESAAEKVRQIGEAAKAAKDQLKGIADSLQDELDRTAGRNEDIENRRYQKQIEDARKLAEETGNLGSAEYRAVLDRARKVHEQNLRDIAEERRVRDEANRQTAADNAAGTGASAPSPSPNPAPSPRPGAPPQPPSRQGASSSGGGNTYNFYVNGRSDEELARKIKKIIEDINRRGK